MTLHERIEKLTRYDEFYDGIREHDDGEFVKRADVLAAIGEGEATSGNTLGDAIGDMKYMRMQLRSLSVKSDIACKFIDRAAEYLDNAVQELEDTTPRGEA